MKKFLVSVFVAVVCFGLCANTHAGVWSSVFSSAVKSAIKSSAKPPRVNFTPYSKITVEIPASGSRTTDFGRANRATDLESTPKGYTWHHDTYNSRTDKYNMQLVPSDKHSSVPHTGGYSDKKNGTSSPSKGWFWNSYSTVP